MYNLSGDFISPDKNIYSIYLRKAYGKGYKYNWI